eukprot:CAMPEP_0184317760 /NCGR_PEP_ID=MMETSP1049-20130417/98531_1 /TAXON_ID=77928 /ORGANISM="Proteomonas sulcata, Strain CCMP704" /LENGTH=286 /DNA_ID=CAMNT_0026637271 /DNA_START=50 /DNA_END=906 /DNA_ORIENTATION=-
MGLRGMDRTLAFMIVQDLQNVVKFYRRQGLVGLKVFLPEFQNELSPTNTLPSAAGKLYASALQRTSKLWPWMIDTVSRVGQAQLLRRQIASELNFSCRLDSPTLSSALEVMNESVINDIRAHYAHPDRKPYPSEDKQLLPSLAPYLDCLGLSCPLLKIYITTEPLDGIACFIFLFVLSQLQQYKYDFKMGILVPKDRGYTFDSTPFVVGVVTLLKQFHSENTQKFVAYMAQYVRCNVVITARESKLKEFPPDVMNILIFLRDFCKYGQCNRDVITQHLPSYLFDTG